MGFVGWLRTLLARCDFRPATRRELHRLRRENTELQMEFTAFVDAITRLVKRMEQRERRAAERAMTEAAMSPEPEPQLAPADRRPSDPSEDPSVLDPVAAARRALFMKRTNPHQRGAIAANRIHAPSQAPSGLRARRFERARPPGADDQEGPDEPASANGEDRGNDAPQGSPAQE